MSQKVQVHRDEIQPAEASESSLSRPCCTKVSKPCRIDVKTRLNAQNKLALLDKIRDFCLCLIFIIANSFLKKNHDVVHKIIQLTRLLQRCQQILEQIDNADNDVVLFAQQY